MLSAPYNTTNLIITRMGYGIYITSIVSFFNSS